MSISVNFYEKTPFFSEESFTLTAKTVRPSAGDTVLNELCDLPWEEMTEHAMIAVAWSYYYFSIQFRENLEIACALYPEDQNLASLKKEEMATANLSPYPQIAEQDEMLDHDEFMRRALLLSPVGKATAQLFHRNGKTYLRDIRSLDRGLRANSIGSYESGGLEQLFKAMLTAPAYDNNKMLQAFRFFMEAHVQFDSDPVNGHGALSQHIADDEATAALWNMFKQQLLANLTVQQAAGQ